VEHGIEKAPTAFLKLFEGENFGKMLVKLARRKQAARSIGKGVTIRNSARSEQLAPERKVACRWPDGIRDLNSILW